jgi:hypothetical protein
MSASPPRADVLSVEHGCPQSATSGRYWIATPQAHDRRQSPRDSEPTGFLSSKPDQETTKTPEEGPGFLFNVGGDRLRGGRMLAVQSIVEPASESLVPQAASGEWQETKSYLSGSA